MLTLSKADCLLIPLWTGKNLNLIWSENGKI